MRHARIVRIEWDNEGCESLSNKFLCDVLNAGLRALGYSERRTGFTILGDPSFEVKDES